MDVGGGEGQRVRRVSKKAAKTVVANCPAVVYALRGGIPAGLSSDAEFSITEYLD
jgi:hypothetical protein